MIEVQCSCPYCGRPAKFEASSSHIYRGRDFGPVWDCRRCDAYVGCHPDNTPKGTLANSALRGWRRRAHELFDPLWEDFRLCYPDMNAVSPRIKALMRRRAYEWLSHHLQVPFEQTHIAMMNEAQCSQVIAIIKQHAPTAVTVRAWAKKFNVKGGQSLQAPEVVSLTSGEAVHGQT